MTVIMGQDLPLERPDTNGRAALFVPTASIKEDVLETVRKGSAIVGFGNHDRTLTIYYESNRFNERLADNLPTVSKMVSKPENFEQVGYISSKGILIRRMEKLMTWLETSDALDTAPTSENVVFTPPPPPKKIT